MESNYFVLNCGDIKKINKTKLIINADDLGIGLDRDEGIFELFNNGHISSASILINGNNFINSVNKAKQLRLPLGIHLNLTEGSLIDQTELKYNSLVYYDSKDNRYKMHGKFNFRDKLSQGLILESDIKKEIINQV
jgi:predicted glycoside hydrolase/deacetylase ChbG (UPF0249 family)